MQPLIGVLRSNRRFLAAGAFLCAFCVASVSQSQQTPTQQSITLKDPTPRPPDLQKEYGAGPADQARQQQAALLRNAQIRQQVVDATNKLCLLAQQLRDDVTQDGKDSRNLNAAKAAQIEKLAKSVKEKMQSQ